LDGNREVCVRRNCVDLNAIIRRAVLHSLFIIIIIIIIIIIRDLEGALKNSFIEKMPYL